MCWHSEVSVPLLSTGFQSVRVEEDAVEYCTGMGLDASVPNVWDV